MAAATGATEADLSSTRTVRGAPSFTDLTQPQDEQQAARADAGPKAAASAGQAALAPPEASSPAAIAARAEAEAASPADDLAVDVAGWHSRDGPQSPLSRLRGSSNALLNEMALLLHEHYANLSPTTARQRINHLSSGSPTRGWRPVYRRTFYVLVVAALLAVTMWVQQVAAQGADTARQIGEEQEALRSRSLELKSSQRQLRNAVAGNALLMGLNVLLAVRGVQIWALLQRVGFDGWVREIAGWSPITRRVGRILNVATLPVRQALRPFRLPFHWRAQQAAQAAAAREAAAAAARAGPITRSLSKVVHTTWGAGVSARSFGERQLRGAFGVAERMLRGGGASIVVK